MSAPTLGSNWKEDLAMLPRGWDGDGAANITHAAVVTLESFATVPCRDGGIQLEVHRDGFDIEICIDGTGKIESALVGRSA